MPDFLINFLNTVKKCVKKTLKSGKIKIENKF